MTCLLVLVALSATSVAQAQTPDGFESMFNGKDLVGWTGSPTYWKVEKGMQVHVGPKMTIEYRDLYLKKLADDLPVIGAAQAPIPAAAVKVVS
jgi:hypothetical protein